MISKNSIKTTTTITIIERKRRSPLIADVNKTGGRKPTITIGTMN